MGFLSLFSAGSALGSAREGGLSPWAGLRRGKGPKRAQNNPFPQEATLPVHPVQPSAQPGVGTTRCPPSGCICSPQNTNASIKCSCTPKSNTPPPSALASSKRRRCPPNGEPPKGSHPSCTPHAANAAPGLRLHPQVHKCIPQIADAPPNCSYIPQRALAPPNSSCIPQTAVAPPELHPQTAVAPPSL